MMDDKEKGIAFLEELILYADAADRGPLEERITKALSEDRCLRRGIWLLGLLTALVVVGFCYSAVFSSDFPERGSPVATVLLCEVGLASLLCLPVFVGLWFVRRNELNQRLEECRCLVSKLLESRLGYPLRAPGTRADQPTLALRLPEQSKLFRAGEGQAGTRTLAKIEEVYRLQYLSKQEIQH